MKTTSNNIALLIPYFGKLPWYFDYFIHSCAYNPTVHFFIITDDYAYDQKVPANVFIIHKTFEEVKFLIREKLEMDVVIENTYKLCDFKPAFGLIFSDLIKGYSFWGMGDIDVIFGNIRNFITEEILARYDVITVRHDFLVGYFTLFRNCELVNGLFRESRDYKKVFTSGEHYCFDECNFAFWKMTDTIPFEDIACEIDSMTHVVKRLQQQEKISVYFNVHAIEGLNGKLKWKEGTLIYNNRYEVILYHLIKLKKKYSQRPPRKIPDEFRVGPASIYYKTLKQDPARRHEQKK